MGTAVTVHLPFRTLAAPAVVVCLSVCFGDVIAAGSVYRSVDEHGNVIYSEKPAAGSANTRAIPIAPPPPEEDVKRAESEAQRIREEADAMERARLQRERVRQQPDEAPTGTTTPPPGGPNPALSPELNPQLDPEELERYLRDNSYQPRTAPRGAPGR